ncbi:MAG: hypothetical protein IJX87_01560 [Clostridia bacterium]|nr:hypothetical protein [Clostridia bacterium]
MIPLNAVLLTARDLFAYAPMVGVLIWLAVALVAFFVGFAHGFRRVSWTGLVCIVATGLFILLNRFIGRYNLNVPTRGGLDKPTVTAMLVAFGVLVAVLIAYGVFTVWMRPSVKLKKKPPIERKYGHEYEDDEEIEQDGAPARRLEYRNCKEPTIFGRIVGGLICIANVTAVTVLIVSAMMFAVKGTLLVNTAVNAVFDHSLAQLAYRYVSRYALDFAMISLIIVIAQLGYKKGLLNSLYTLLVGVGSIVLGVLAFGLPFVASRLGGKLYFTTKLVERCTALLGRLPEIIRPFAGKLLAGVGLFVLFMALVIIIKLILSKCSKAVASVGPIRAVDGACASVVYFIVGLLVCIAIWCVLYVFDYCGIFRISEILSEEATLSKGLFELCGKALKLVVGKIR